MPWCHMVAVAVDGLSWHNLLKPTNELKRAYIKYTL